MPGIFAVTQRDASRKATMSASRWLPIGGSRRRQGASPAEGTAATVATRRYGVNRFSFDCHRSRGGRAKRRPLHHRGVAARLRRSHRSGFSYRTVSSHLPEILSWHGKLPVVFGEEGADLEPGRVYVA